MKTLYFDGYLLHYLARMAGVTVSNFVRGINNAADSKLRGERRKDEIEVLKEALKLLG